VSPVEVKEATSEPVGRLPGKASASERARRRSRGWSGYWYLGPALVVYALFVLRPLAESVWYSLYAWDGIAPATWVGLANYSTVLGDSALRSSVAHTLVFVVFYSLLPVGIGLLIAGIVARAKVRGLTLFRALLFVPQVLPTVVVAVAWRWIYNEDGPLNRLAQAAGLGGLTRAWLGDFQTALAAVGLIGTWVEYGLCMVLFIAGVQRIPTHLYEAARLDGCGPIREFWVVTLPDLREEIGIALVLTMIFALRNFDIIWNTTSGGPGTATRVPSLFIYQTAFVSREVGVASAASVLLTVLILAVAGTITRLTRVSGG
jgi:raffinose/stachyose/melibiose transport system permease protein